MYITLVDTHHHYGKSHATTSAIRHPLKKKRMDFSTLETGRDGYGFMATKTLVVAWESVCEELTVLQSVYCREGECEIAAPPGLTFENLEDYRHNRSPEDIEVKLKLVLEPNTKNCICPPNSFQALVSITLPIRQFYPYCAYPKVSVSSKYLSPKELCEIDDKAIKFMKSKASYCLFTLLEYVKEELQQIASTRDCTIGCNQSSSVRHELTSSQKQAEDETHVLIAHLDHMRNPSKYFKVLRLWAMQLHIGGIVLNAGVHAIYVVLTGRPGNLREFVKRWRTQSIDVDSHGCPCKERMLNIIYQESIGITTPNL